MAAGLGFKTFTTGEVLSAGDTNGYLMQGVLVFATAAARDAAITSPQEGQTCYLKSTDAVMTYSGSAWVAVGGAAGASAYGKNLSAGANKSTTSTSYVAIDTTNLRITATPIGTIAVATCTGMLSNSGVTTVDWRVNCGSGTTHGFQAYNSTYDGTVVFPTRTFVITGLTAGTSYNFDWEWKVNAGTTTLIGDTSSVYPRFQVVC